MSVLTIEALNKSYGTVRAVQDVSLTVERGDVYGLLGPNGSGKTTTLSCALGLLTPDSGRIGVLGVPAAQIHRTLGRVGVVFDGATLVDGLTCRQNLQYARRLLGHTGGRTDAELLALTGIGHLAERRANRLSLGQRRRLSIARALLGTPELVVLDEPLSGLDTVGVRAMLELFRTLRSEGLTLVVSSHRLHEMETIVNRVAILLGGRLVREATLDELLAGRRAHLHVRATPLPQARALLAALPGLERVDPAEDGLLTVWPGTLTPAAVNRALVGGGCDVSVLAPERLTLQSVFESLVDGARADGVEIPA